MRRHAVLRVVFGCKREPLRAVAGSVHHGIDVNRIRLSPDEMNLPAGAGPHHPFDRRIERDGAATILDITPQREHEAVAVDDACLCRKVGRDAEQAALEAHRI